MDLKDKTIAVLGDSVTKGFDGTVNLRYNYPRYLAKYYNCHVFNKGINGATIYETLEKEIEKIKDKQYDVIILMIGTNDYGHLDVSLVRVLSKLTTLVRKLMTQHSEAKIYAVLPLTRYDNDQNAASVVRYADYTFNDLLNGISDVYSAFQLPFIDWREYNPEFITDFNYKEMYQDQHVHPNAYTYRKLAFYIGDFIKNN
ncbi:hypothetical protein AKUA2003_02420 [Apilactobacillus kunkeei]|nr:hypothetical protein AKUA2003_02420 [Apilactobacillus kunkeei]CAI2565588.1 hypothetical protein AKUA1001_02440 [Apilactobacillus kunkeei]CAI2801330.1 hypothetical protein AKUA2002_02420 [Apilactobacillus kunkeei]